MDLLVFKYEPVVYCTSSYCITAMQQVLWYPPQLRINITGTILIVKTFTVRKDTVKRKEGRFTPIRKVMTNPDVEYSIFGSSYRL